MHSTVQKVPAPGNGNLQLTEDATRPGLRSGPGGFAMKKPSCGARGFSNFRNIFVNKLQEASLILTAEVVVLIGRGDNNYLSAYKCITSLPIQKSCDYGCNRQS
jgi:hypothetical protein